MSLFTRFGDSILLNSSLKQTLLDINQVHRTALKATANKKYEDQENLPQSNFSIPPQEWWKKWRRNRLSNATSGMNLQTARATVRGSFSELVLFPYSWWPFHSVLWVQYQWVYIFRYAPYQWEVGEHPFSLHRKKCGHQWQGCYFASQSCHTPTSWNISS